MHYLVRLFPEITIKSPPVRKRLTRQVRDNLRKLLQRLSPDISVARDWEKITIEVPPHLDPMQDQVEAILRDTPGVSKFSRVNCFPFSGLEDLADKVVQRWAGDLEGKTFCVRMRRKGNHGFNSMEAEKFLGSRLFLASNSAGVRLKNPDITVGVEIDGDEVRLVESSASGLGGYPIGSQDSVLSMISGGFDSTVASYLCMKRGLHTHYCFFNLGGRAHELGVKEVAYYLWQKFGASHRVKFVTVPFEGVVAEILTKVDNAYMGVVLKRMMYRAATVVAESLEVNALVTGESVAQVASQTLVNLRVIDSVTDMLTLRPLSVMDKGEIIDISRAIGTESFAANMPEYCGVISVRPTTRAKLERVEKEEEFFDMSVLDAAVTNRREEVIDNLLMEDQAPADSVVIHQVPQPGAIVVDIRHPDEISRQPLKAGNAAILQIPFYALDKKSVEFDPRIQYMLYCDRGVMSRLHAELLREKGLANVSVYRPAS